MKQKLQPIFIMGAPRSGTTMLAGMLSNRSDTLALPEMHYIHELLQDELLYGTVDKDIIKDTLNNHFMFKDIDILTDEYSMDKLIAQNVNSTIYNILKKYNEKYIHKDFDKWVEHSPHNHKYFEVLLSKYPNAKFIHILRDGRAVYRSTKEVDWGYKDIITGSKNWRENVTSCLIKEKAFSDKVYTVRYEDLTTESERSLKNICEFLEIDFQKNMLESKGIKKPNFAKYTKDLGKKANTKSHTKWKETLSKKEIAHFTAYNEKLLRKFNYDIKSYDKRELKGLEKLLTKILGRLKVVYFQRLAKKRFNKE